MPAIRMTHPEHGATHVYSDTEQAEHVKHGWSVDAPAPAADPPTVASVRAQLNAAGIAYDKRFGLDRLISLLP